MSVSKWAYESDKCDGGYCIGDCDKCMKAELNDTPFLLEPYKGE